MNEEMDNANASSTQDQKISLKLSYTKYACDSDYSFANYFSVSNEFLQPSKGPSAS